MLNVVPSNVNGPPPTGWSEKLLQPVPKQAVVVPAIAKLVIGAAQTVAEPRTVSAVNADAQKVFIR
jgi:hypothetical protein